MIATLWIIALREARDQWTSRRMGLAGLVCAVLVMVSLALLVADYEERKRGFDQRDAAGFIKLNALRLRLLGRRDRI